MFCPTIRRGSEHSETFDRPVIKGVERKGIMSSVAVVLIVKMTSWVDFLCFQRRVVTIITILKGIYGFINELHKLLALECITGRSLCNEPGQHKCCLLSTAYCKSQKGKLKVDKSK